MLRVTFPGVRRWTVVAFPVRQPARVVVAEMGRRHALRLADELNTPAEKGSGEQTTFYAAFPASEAARRVEASRRRVSGAPATEGGEPA